GLEGKPVAYLRQRFFVVVREPVKRFAHRAFPFRVIEFKTLRSPNLVIPALDESIKLAEAPKPPDPPGIVTAFWPRFGEGGTRKDVFFQIEGTDWDGKTTSLAVPQIFVPATADLGADIPKLVAAYNGEAGAFPAIPEGSDRRSIPTGSQKIA